MSCCSVALGLAGSGIRTGSSCAQCWPGLTGTLVQEHNLLDTPYAPTPFFVWECSLVQGIPMARMQRGWGLQTAVSRHYKEWGQGRALPAVAVHIHVDLLLQHRVAW